MYSAPINYISDLHNRVGIKSVLNMSSSVAMEAPLAKATLWTSGIEFWTLAIGFPVCSQNVNFSLIVIPRSVLTLDPETVVWPM